MPDIEDISYSREATIATIRDYYHFLVKMYLDEAEVIEPPKGGWPTVTTENLRCLGKTDEVIALLRHLPYIRCPQDSRHNAHAAAWCHFADWQALASPPPVSHQSDQTSPPDDDDDGLRLCSESVDLYEDVPPHVVSLTYGNAENPVFLLDTQLGIVHWYECPGEIQSNLDHDPNWLPRVVYDPYDYADDGEAEWREQAAAWATVDFFEILKMQFRKLAYVPTSQWSVKDVYATSIGPGTEGLLSMVQDIYRQHGWPEEENHFRKQECLDAVKAALEERYPD